MTTDLLLRAARATRDRDTAFVRVTGGELISGAEFDPMEGWLSFRASRTVITARETGEPVAFIERETQYLRLPDVDGWWMVRLNGFEFTDPRTPIEMLAIEPAADATVEGDHVRFNLSAQAAALANHRPVAASGRAHIAGDLIDGVEYELRYADDQGTVVSLIQMTVRLSHIGEPHELPPIPEHAQPIKNAL